MNANLGRVAANRFQVVHRSVAIRLPGLGHQVGDQDDPGTRAGNSICQVLDKEDRDEARVEASRPDDDQVRGLKRRKPKGEGTGVGRFEVHPANLTGGGADLRLALNGTPVGELGAEGDVVERGRDNPPSDRQELSATLHGLTEAVPDPAESRENQVPETVTGGLPLPVETKVEELGHHRVAVGESEKAVSNIPRGEDAVFPPKSA